MRQTSSDPSMSPLIHLRVAPIRSIKAILATLCLPKPTSKECAVPLKKSHSPELPLPQGIPLEVCQWAESQAVLEDHTGVQLPKRRQDNSQVHSSWSKDHLVRARSRECNQLSRARPNVQCTVFPLTPSSPITCRRPTPDSNQIL